MSDLRKTADCLAKFLSVFKSTSAVLSGSTYSTASSVLLFRSEICRALTDSLDDCTITGTRLMKGHMHTELSNSSQCKNHTDHHSTISPPWKNIWQKIASLQLTCWGSIYRNTQAVILPTSPLDASASQDQFSQVSNKDTTILLVLSSLISQWHIIYGRHIPVTILGRQWIFVGEKQRKNLGGAAYVTMHIVKYQLLNGVWYCGGGVGEKHKFGPQLPSCHGYIPAQNWTQKKLSRLSKLAKVVFVKTQYTAH